MSHPRNRRLVALPLVALLAAAGVAGCFSDRVNVLEPEPGGGPTGQQLCSGLPSEPNVVRIRDYQYSPATLTVAPGTEVTFVNCDSDAHTATSTGGSWDSGLMTQNVVYKRTFAASGRFDYLCSPHPFMTGAVVVE